MYPNPNVQHVETNVYPNPNVQRLYPNPNVQRLYPSPDPNPNVQPAFILTPMSNVYPTANPNVRHLNVQHEETYKNIIATFTLYLACTYLLTPVVITAMPATCCNSASEPRSAAPYSLSGASRPQLTALTVAALKSHLKHFKLLTSNHRKEIQAS